jgi:hypothetical protein
MTTDPVRRVHYFAGQRLTPDDLQAEQDYHRRMRYLHNRLLGQGVVYGLDVTAGDGATVLVSPGLAIDGLGREIVLTDDVHLPVPGTAPPDASLDVVVSWAEEAESFVPPTEDGGDEPAFTRWLERPRLTLEACGRSPAGSESLVLARVDVTAGAIAAVDRSRRSGWQPGSRSTHGRSSDD